MKKHIWKIILGVVVILMGSSFFYAQYASTKANEGVVLTDHIKGNKDASVTLTEYSDFQCPACAQFYPIIKNVMEEHGDKIAFEYKHFPLSSLHPHAIAAAKAAEAAGVQGKFFEMHDKLFENQNTWSKSATPQAFFNGYAEELGLDVSLFKQHMRSALIKEKVDAEFKEARELGFTGTPSFLLNGQKFEFSTYEEFIGAIESAVGVGGSSTSTSTSTTTEQEVKFGI